MRVLVASANFAPRGTSAAVRTVHLVRDLVRRGHEVKVVTYERGVQLLFSPEDSSLERKVPPEVEVIRLPPGLFHRATGGSKALGASTETVKRRLVKAALSALVIPDPHVAARRSFIDRADALIQSWCPHVLLTFSYPFTFTLVGAAIKKRHPGLAWVADYGDPWTGSPVTELNLPGWRRALDRNLERRALACSDAVTLTTASTVELYEKEFPFLAGRLHVVPMGYDPEDSESVVASPRPQGTEDSVLMIHAGRIYGEARDPVPFIDAVARLHRQDPALASRLKVQLLGEVEPSIREAVERSAGASSFLFSGWVTVGESLAAMKAADWLLLFGNKGAVQIPGKLYQYLGMERPVFMTREVDADPTAAILDRLGRSVVSPNNADDLSVALASILGDDAVEPQVKASPTEFSWPSLAADLEHVFEVARTKPSEP